MKESLSLKWHQVNEFLRDIEILENKSPRTVTLYGEILRELFKEFENTVIDEAQLQNFIKKRTRHLQATTLSLWISALKRFFIWAKKRNYYQGRLEKILVRPRVVQKLISVFDQEDLKKLFLYINKQSHQERLLFALLYGCGFRISEALKIKWSDIDLQKSTLKIIGKGKKLRRIPITPLTLKELQIYKKNFKNLVNEDFWCAHKESDFRKWVKKWGQETGLSEKFGSFHPHKLRHSIATHLIQRGAKLPELQRFLGHKHLQTTVRYTHLDILDLCKVYDESFPQFMQSPFDQNKK
jgi:integrase/recombinase XerC